LVAAATTAHPQAAPSLAIIDTARADRAWCAVHSLAELYATLTAMPGPRARHPDDVRRAVERATTLFTPVSLTVKEYLTVIHRTADERARSGQVYDALILKAAEKSGADVIYTWNLKHFQALAPDSIADRIRTP
jgi:predicted nucleic acid-binding protein